MMVKTTGEISIIYLLLKILFIVLLNLKFVISSHDQIINTKANNHSCYSCVEPLVGYSKNFLF
jgi:hypothetical protein